MGGLRYRLALDLGSTSLGWAMVRIKDDEPVAIIKAGVRIFSDGRNPKDGSSLAVTRRAARAMRRRRDRLLKRKNRMMALLLKHGFFPADATERKALELLNPYELRAKGLDEPLTPAEFARALFHINQRRGFKSNRKTDKKDNDSGALKTAIGTLRQQLDPSGADGKARTVGELLWRRIKPKENGQPLRAGLVRARYRECRVEKEDGKTRINKSYDLYIDRAMIEAEFDALWAKQAALNPAIFAETARAELKDCLLYQRPLKPVKPGRCTLEPDEERAPLALPSQQRFRIYQEVNNLRILGEDLRDEPLTLEQRNRVVALLERPQRDKKTAHEVSFDQIRTALGLSGNTKFNLEDAKRSSLKGNSTSSNLSRKHLFGPTWFDWSPERQDEIVTQLLTEEISSALIDWLQKETGVDKERAEAIAEASLADGYGSLSRKALAKILPRLQAEVISAKEAEIKAGYKFAERTGEILPELPYYGEPESMQRHVGFGSGNPDDTPEKRYGKIANPTVHIGLNQVRVVINALIRRYGHPSEVIIEVASELKRPADHRKKEFRIGKITKETMRRYCSCAGCMSVRQAINQELNKELRTEATKILGRKPSDYDMEKMRLWHEAKELNGGVVICPYSGETLGVERTLSSAVEIDHILPHSITLDDGLANKVLCVQAANRIKRERPPTEAKDDFLQLKGWKYEDILARVKNWPEQKRYRFGADAMEKWKGRADTFLARALNDTRYLSRVAREYLSLICPQDTRVIPGRMTALLREKLGLNDILGLKGMKNRNDHRHHAVDACVIAVTDQGMLQKFAQASASAREKGLDRLIDTLDPPWLTYYDHVKRAVHNIWVSHKPDHDYQDEMFDQTIYNAQGFSKIAAKIRSVIPFGTRQGSPSKQRHTDENGQPKPYKGLLSNSNYCIEIVRSGSTWEGDVIPTFKAYEFIRQFRKLNQGSTERQAFAALRSPTKSIAGKPLVMRLSINDSIRVEIDGVTETLQVLKINSSGSITFIKINETNIPNRYIAKLAAQKLAAEGKAFDEDALSDDFFQKAMSATSLRDLKARRITISPIGDLRDPGFKE